jgi:hypothetical protein
MSAAPKRALEGGDWMKIYVASSWRNLLQGAVVASLRDLGYEVYDFRNPAPGNNGFGWKEIDGGWQTWTPQQFKAALQTPTALAGFALDANAVDAADACVLVLPCGRSAHLEAGVAIGSGKPTAILILEQCEPELMYRWAEVCLSMDELFDWAESAKQVAKVRAANRAF